MFLISVGKGSSFGQALLGSLALPVKQHRNLESFGVLLSHTLPQYLIAKHKRC
jgi:hypothetical protein